MALTSHLRPADNTPGLWLGRDWTPGQPGTFAVIIGVSEYKNLPPVGTYPDPYVELNKLLTSAYTAYRFFDWLNTSYSFRGNALARCWLLLAPSDTDRRLAPDIDSHGLLPSFEACERALKDWYNAMLANKDAGATPRAFFYFSGHGFLNHMASQVLVPWDYAERRPNTDAIDTLRLNDALKTLDLKGGLERLRIPATFFFLDACRSKPIKLEQVADTYVEGASILGGVPPPGHGELGHAPMFYATADGDVASQPRDDLTYFGHALIDGLNQRVEPPLSHANHTYQIEVMALYAYVKAELLRLTHNLQRLNPSERGWDPSSEVVTEVDLGDGPPPPKGPPVEPQPRPTRYATVLDDPAGRPLEPGAASDLNAHLGAAWNDLLLAPLDDPGAARSWDALTVYRALRTEPGPNGLQRVRLSVSAPRASQGYWLQVRGAERDLACVLPDSGDAETPEYALNLVLDERGLLTLQAEINRPSTSPLGSAAFVAFAAQQSAELPPVPEAVWTAPLAAAVAAGALLFIGRRDRLPGNWRPQADLDLVDLDVLQVEYDIGGDFDLDRAAANLLRIRDVGLPVTQLGMSFAAVLVERLLADEQLDQDRRTQLQYVQLRLNTAFRRFNPRGTFSAFVGDVGSLNPYIVAGELVAA